MKQNHYQKRLEEASGKQCMNCPSRKVTADYNCHDHCPLYAEYKKANEERKKREALARISFVPANW